MSENSKRFTEGEEIANAVSHGIGIIFGIVALVFMMIVSVKNHGHAGHYVSAAIYGTSLIILFISSTLNHSLPDNTRAKNFFHNFDQIAIYFLIAGTYTPLALVALRGDSGWSMFGMEWGLALVGIVAKLFLPNKFEKGVNLFVILSYLVLGWLMLFYLPQFYANIGPMGVGFIFIGGGVYTLGIIFFLLENRFKFSHLIWHIFVLGGAVCHWIAIWRYVLVK